VETKVNYAIVGVFVLTLSTAIIAGVLWISSGRSARKDYDTYLAYFTESVSGLNPNAPVKYKGVAVGKVREISLDPQDPERVRLELAIERGAPIKQDTVAELRVQGLTGIAFVDLSGGSRSAPPLLPPEDGGLPVIPTRPSLLARLDSAGTSLLSDLSVTAQNINELVDDQTRLALQRTIRDLDRVVHVIAMRSEAIDASLADAATTLDNSAQASARLNELTARVIASAASIERAAAEAERAGAAVRNTVEEAAGGVRQFSAESLPELQRLLEEARMATASLGRVARELERNPNVLVLGRPSPPRGPGE
jgi:phospholipid/cholesterol/gamma-HCH transport system substrate-binding protein